MRALVMGLHEVDSSLILEVGGKGASLGELSRLHGVRVPDGFCVTTTAFSRALSGAGLSEPGLSGLLDRLAGADDPEAIRAISAEIRAIILAISLPDELVEAIAGALTTLGEHTPCAVRSSATAEDLPGASFAGLHDSFLNVVGLAAILEQVRRCWASLFTERAVRYRVRQGFDHRRVQMAVVVQRMLAPRAAGVLFTADPVSGHRGRSCIEAVFGLGEALVSGQASPDRYLVQGGEIRSRAVASPDAPAVLTDEQILALECLGRRVEAHFGRPQDIEWCLVDEELSLVQSRPITTLYPIPDHGPDPGPGALGKRLFMSVGHQQMMTDPMRPLGLSIFQLSAGRPMFEAGGRLFVDPTAQLAAPASRAALLALIGHSEPLFRDALDTVLARPDFFPPVPEGAAPPAPAPVAPVRPAAPPVPDPALVPELIAASQALLQASRRKLAPLSGAALLDGIQEDIQDLRRSLADPRSFPAVMAGMNAASWLNEHMQAWLGEPNVADALAQSVPHNVTTEMGLALLDVADVIRPFPEVIAWLERASDADLWQGFASLTGGPEASEALATWMDAYGMRGVGEIDLSRPRWSERPTTLVPLILGHVRGFPPGEAERRRARGLAVAAQMERSLLSRLGALPEGEAKAAQTKAMIDQLRAFTGYREHPKYNIIGRFFVYKQALMAEAGRLSRAGLLDAPEDIFYLYFSELPALVSGQRLDPGLLARRQEQHALNHTLRPPRVITSEGEIIQGSYRRAALPAGALVGLAVSSGVVEGRARVRFDLAEARVEEGDILVTPYTDPSWTPLFVSLRGLVTEVGGLMTHGAVIARELGLPAVVGVEGATERIRDGQRIRVNGVQGWVELLPDP